MRRIRTVESRRFGDPAPPRQSALTLKGFSKVEVRAHPEVVDLPREGVPARRSSSKPGGQLHNRKLKLTVLVPDQSLEDSVLRYLRADGREVRPGGRRKR